MKIAAIAAGTTALVNKQVETSVQKLMFDVLFPSALPVTTMTEIKAVIAAAFSGTFLTVTHQGDNGFTPARRIALGAYLEFGTNENGYLRIDSDGTNARIRGTIKLSNTGAHRFDDKRAMVINIEGKQTTATMDIYAMDSQATASNCLVFTERAFEANTEKDITCGDVDLLCIPVDLLTAMEISYNNGTKVEYTQEELKQELADAQDPILTANGKVFHGYFNYAIVNVEAAWKVKLVLSAAANVFVVKTQTV